MNKCQLAGYFNVSRPTVNDWQRRGAPITKDGGDPATLAEWRAQRDLAANDLDALLPGLPALVAEHTRRRMDLVRRIGKVNTWPPNVTCEPGLIKASVVSGLILEQELLGLPRRVIAESKPETLPEDIYRIIFAALDRARSGEDVR